MRPVFMVGVVCALGAVGAARGDNMIVNGTFDLSVPNDGFGNGWTGTGNDGAGGWRSSGGNPGGFYIMNAGGAGGSDPTVGQIVTGLTIGESYRVTGDYYLYWTTSGSSSAKSFGAFIDGATMFEVSRSEVVEGAWNAFTFDFVATAETASLLFAAERNSTDYGYAIDNITMDVVPGPGAIVLLSAGVLGARRRR